MENTSTFLVLGLKQLRRLRSMYCPNMRRLENLFQRVLYSVVERLLSERSFCKKMSLCRTLPVVHVTSNTLTK